VASTGDNPQLPFAAGGSIDPLCVTAGNPMIASAADQKSWKRPSRNGLLGRDIIRVEPTGFSYSLHGKNSCQSKELRMAQDAGAIVRDTVKQ
jgi:hypothetical protein